MPIRTFGLQTIGAGTSQPLFGDVMTAAMVLPTDTFDGRITVANTKIYEAGDRLILDPEATDQDVVLVDSIASATVLNVRSEGNLELKPHASGTVISLAIAATLVRVQTNIGNAAVMWLGADKTVTAAGAGLAFWQLGHVAAAAGAVADSYTYEAASINNGVNTNHIWVAGTAADKFLAVAEVN